MKLGTENKKKLIAAVSLFVVAIALVANWVLSSPSGETVANATAPDPPAVSLPQTSKAKSGKKVRVAAAPSIDPSLRYDLLKTSEDTNYEGHGRNIFQDQAEIPTPVASAILAQKKIDNTPPPPPPPPPINLKFFGFSNRPGEGRKVFLSQGEDVFIAHEGDIVDRRYRVLHIMPTAVEIEDVLNNNRQSIPLVQG